VAEDRFSIRQSEATSIEVPWLRAYSTPDARWLGGVPTPWGLITCEVQGCRFDCSMRPQKVTFGAWTLRSESSPVWAASPLWPHRHGCGRDSSGCARWLHSCSASSSPSRQESRPTGALSVRCAAQQAQRTSCRTGTTSRAGGAVHAGMEGMTQFPHSVDEHHQCCHDRRQYAEADHGNFEMKVRFHIRPLQLRRSCRNT